MKLLLYFLTSLALYASEGQKGGIVSDHLFQQKLASYASEGQKGAELAIWSVIPFVFILLSIAVLPIFSKKTMHWWENNNNKLLVSLGLGSISFFILITNNWGSKISHTLFFEYVPFIILLGSLYYISGGILLKGDIEATPKNNTIFILIGTLLASFIGTTGASMLLIRPLLKTNSEREHVVHTVIFFIFLVSNIGGSLTPLGDPPLFLGYLQGVPFTWTFILWPKMLVASIILLIVYFIWDTVKYKAEDKEHIQADKTQIEPLTLKGKINFVWLLGIILSVAFINSNYISAIKDNPHLGFIREAVMLFMVFLSKLTTPTNPQHLRKENKFTFHPIIEVAYLFIGIFICMIPALILLEKDGEALGISKPWQFFWATGLFSSILDNAPTYLTFLSLSKSVLGVQEIAEILADPAKELFLTAISLGAVFMGANSYIGNAPNFMVKAVAEESKVKMPSFGVYMIYSTCILFPVFILITFLFLL